MPMTTGLAAISTHKSCTSVEEAEDCFNLAKSSLEAFSREFMIPREFVSNRPRSKLFQSSQAETALPSALSAHNLRESSRSSDGDGTLNDDYSYHEDEVSDGSQDSGGEHSSPLRSNFSGNVQRFLGLEAAKNSIKRDGNGVLQGIDALSSGYQTLSSYSDPANRAVTDIGVTRPLINITRRGISPVDAVQHATIRTDSISKNRFFLLGKQETGRKLNSRFDLGQGTQPDSESNEYFPNRSFRKQFNARRPSV